MSQVALLFYELGKRPHATGVCVWVLQVYVYVLGEVDMNACMGV